MDAEEILQLVLILGFIVAFFVLAYKFIDELKKQQWAGHPGYDNAYKFIKVNKCSNCNTIRKPEDLPIEQPCFECGGKVEESKKAAKFTKNKKAYYWQESDV